MMTWTLRFIALAPLVVTTMATVAAEPAAGPPAWKDQGSVYLSMSQAVAEKPPASQAFAESSQGADRRRLAPPSARLANVSDDPASTSQRSINAASRRLATFGLPTQSMYTIVSALAIVVGAFLLFMWLLKRSGRATGRRGALPADVVSVLGRVPLAARQCAELLRVGNKLVLVSLTPTGAETLTEVTDPAEVDRLLGLCQQGNPFSTTKAFEQVFQQMSSEAAPGGFLGNEPFVSSVASPAGAYRANRGGTTRG